jgi:hypothetical protein
MVNQKSTDTVTPSKNPIRQRMRRQGVYFGLITAIMTIVPFQIGIVASGNSDVQEILSSIVSMSVADSMADAYGIFFSNEASDSNIKQSDAILASVMTFITKIICQLSFTIPFFLTKGVHTPTIINCVWGSIVLLLSTYRVAKQRGVSEIKYIARTSLFTGMIIACSYYLTKYISRQKK